MALSHSKKAPLLLCRCFTSFEFVSGFRKSMRTRLDKNARGKCSKIINTVCPSKEKHFLEKERSI